MSAKTTLFAAALSLSLSGCFCLPNPCCQMGPACPPPMAPAMAPAMAPGLPAAMFAPLTTPFTCNVPQTPVYQPVSMSLMNANCPQPRTRPLRLRQQRLLKDSRCTVPDYYPPVKPRLYRPIRQRKTTIKDVFRDRVVWGKPKWKEDKYPGVVKDPPRTCDCEKCRQHGGSRRSSQCLQGDGCGDIGGCGENDCAVPGQVWSDYDGVTQMQVQQPWDVCGEGCVDYDMMTASTASAASTSPVSPPVDATPDSTPPADGEREFATSNNRSVNSVPPPAPIPPPDEEPLETDDEVPQRLDPPPMDMTTPAAGGPEDTAEESPIVIDPPPTDGANTIEQTSLEIVPVLDFSVLEEAAGHGKDRAEIAPLLPSSVTRRQIQ